MKILWKGNIWNPTGIATANREICKELKKLGHQVQTIDPWHNKYEVNKGLEYLNHPINVDEETRTIFADYPNTWRDGYGKLFGFFLHEGTKTPPGWVEKINNSVEKFFVPSEATKNLFKWSGLKIPIKVIPYGVSDIYKPKKEEDSNFIFLSVNSWTGKLGDRKGTDLLIKAFNEEFGNDPNIILVLKISTFWSEPIDYLRNIHEILGYVPENIMVSSEYMPEEKLVEVYQKADCFVSPTRGEAFGLTILNAKACGLPVIVTKDMNSGHMDFCKDDSNLFIDTLGVAQGDPVFYCQGNYQPIVSIDSLKKQMRFAVTHKEKLNKLAFKNSEIIKENYTWASTAKQLVEEMK